MKESAFRLALHGHRVFPLRVGGKRPAHVGWQTEATDDLDVIDRLWNGTPYNVGIAIPCGIGVVDIDTKNGKDGYESLRAEGILLPDTLRQTTPSGGEHHFFALPYPVRNAVGLLPGVDLKTEGGYVVGAGSVVDGRTYRGTVLPVVPMPDEIVHRLRRRVASEVSVLPGTGEISTAVARCIDLLSRRGEVAAGERNASAFVLACAMKRLGCSQEEAGDLLATQWKCSPPLEDQELTAVVRSAYRTDSILGEDAPERQFAPVETPPGNPGDFIDQMNRGYAYAVVGSSGQILWNTTNERDEKETKMLGVATFHQHLANRWIEHEGGKTQVSRMWMLHPRRRSYDGVVFTPGEDPGNRFYNLWRGFSVTPPAEGEILCQKAHEALAMYREHMRMNVCGGDSEVDRWLLGYFAQLVQQPSNKPPVALVFQGQKGVGKNMLIKPIAKLLGAHALLAAKRRYLIGNFNAHLRHCLLLELDEAFWSGDKEADGILKDLISGDDHLIEPKGLEAYRVRNCTRVVILGNERWLVPATQDERRFAVFHVGTRRQGDLRFWETMWSGMQAGGFRLLLDLLQKFDLSTVDLRKAPETRALLDQKIVSLPLVAQWWYASLQAGRIEGGDFPQEWTEGKLEKRRVRDAFCRYVRELNVSSRFPSDEAFGHELRSMCPSVTTGRTCVEGDRVPVYLLPSLDMCRMEFDAFIRQEVRWNRE